MSLRPRIIQVVGSTASGKTDFSVTLAEDLGAELLNVDSMQVYRDLAIGTDKPGREACTRVHIHGIDLIDLGPPLDASAFAEYADGVIAEAASRGKACILSGGTGLYHRAILHGLIDAPTRDDAIRARLRQTRDQLGIAAMHDRLTEIDPEAAQKIYPTDWVRIERALEVYEITGTKLSLAHAQHGFRTQKYDRLALGCWRPRKVLYEKIERRLDEMWTTGILEETKRMLDCGLPTDTLPLKALGYRQAAMALLGECSSSEALALAKQETRRFAKRQLTWFRADKTIHWLPLPLDAPPYTQLLKACRLFLETGQTDLSGIPLEVFE
ncbi:MAG: tRNA (adenosine(37)-N6)-dimethylallyltransferase MiaA [Proteobacteria bacterium]|nr:tRNA (adenosine(37)-N6)-dimethylallyltransferase MiaA [Pseudomonadota bacterium]